MSKTGLFYRGFEIWDSGRTMSLLKPGASVSRHQLYVLPIESLCEYLRRFFIALIAEYRCLVIQNFSRIAAEFESQILRGVYLEVGVTTRHPSGDLEIKVEGGLRREDYREVMMCGTPYRVPEIGGWVCWADSPTGSDEVTISLNRPALSDAWTMDTPHGPARVRQMVGLSVSDFVGDGSLVRAVYWQLKHDLERLFDPVRHAPRS